MTVDINLLGWRFYVNLDKPKPVAESNDGPPTQLSQPMQVRAGYVGYYQTRAADATEARSTNDQETQ